MTLAEFRRLADAHKITGRTREALRLVYVDGLTAYAAARRIGIEQSAISRAKQRFLRPLCPHCHRPSPPKSA
jgi:DNA-directed RNA polymerase specialized sigma subunit